MEKKIFYKEMKKKGKEITGKAQETYTLTM